MTIESRDWNNAHEAAFIRGLGTHSESASIFSRQELLDGYRASLEKRVNWGNMNGAMIRQIVAEVTK